MNSTTSDNMSEKTESVNLREEAYCDGEPTESIRALLLGKDRFEGEKGHHTRREGIPPWCASHRGRGKPPLVQFGIPSKEKGVPSPIGPMWPNSPSTTWPFKAR